MDTYGWIASLVIAVVLVLGPIRAFFMRRARIKVVIESVCRPPGPIFWETPDGFRAYMLGELDQMKKKGNVLGVVTDRTVELVLQIVSARNLLSRSEVVSTLTITGQKHLVDKARMILEDIARREGNVFFPK